MPELKTPDCSHAKRSDTQTFRHSGQRATATDRRAKALRPVAKDARAKAQDPGAKDARAGAHELIYTMYGNIKKKVENLSKLEPGRLPHGTK